MDVSQAQVKVGFINFPDLLPLQEAQDDASHPTTLPPEAENGHQPRGFNLTSYVQLVGGSDHSASKGTLEPAPSCPALFPCNCTLFLLSEWFTLLPPNYSQHFPASAALPCLQGEIQTP